jgi:hypothetical protein
MKVKAPKITQPVLTHIAIKPIDALLNNVKIIAKYGDLLTLTEDQAGFLKQSVLPITRKTQ